MDRRRFSQLAIVGTTAGGSAIAHIASTVICGEDEPKTAAAPEIKDVSNNTPVAVAEYEARAESILPRPTFEYISTGSADQITLRDNVAAFQRIQVLPPLLRGVTTPNLSTLVLGQRISMPVMLAPVAGQLLYHPQGALASARAAAQAGTVFGVSSSVMNSVEEVAAASTGPKWFQLYLPKDREIGKRLVERAERAGFRAIILTVDLGEWKDADRRNRFTLPRSMLIKHLRDIGFTGNFDRMSDEELNQFNSEAWDMGMKWEVLDWLRGVTRLPLILKGVLRPDDAVRAVAAGVDGLVVSNHGGRRLDGMPATIDALPKVVAAVNGKAEIYLDGGIRRGTDVLKALALGAKAVLIGRPYAWALAARGEEGVAHVLELLRAELVNAMSTCGCENVSEIKSDLLRIAR